MQPTENKQPAQEELIAHVRKSLKAHEEPYNLGAWEKFNAKQQTKRTPIFWMTRLGGVAAVIAVCFSLFLLTKTNPGNETNGVVKVIPDQKEEQLQNPMANDHLEKIELEGYKVIPQHTTSVADKDLSKLLAISSNKLGMKTSKLLALNEPVIENTQQAGQSNYQDQNKDVINKQSDEKTAVINEGNTKQTTVDYLIRERQRNESAPERIANNSNKSKWVLGLMLAPSIGNAEELNMGYGLSMAYNFSDKLSLVTGVSYNEMSASKDFTSSIGTSSILYGNNKSLAAISQKVTGLDIPLELKYSFNSKVYASLGVSAFAVIGQSRSNTFIQGVVVNGTTGKSSTSSNASPGSSSPSDLSSSKGQFENTYILNKKVVERADSQGQNNVNYLGFYNFSIGYKKKMLKSHFVAFEPFIKLPIREVTQDNLKLVGAGLRVKVDF